MFSELLDTDDKKAILEGGFNKCMENHLCGNYFNVSDIEGLECSDIEWNVDLDNFKLYAFTDFGSYSVYFNFDYSFDENLNSFFEDLQDFLRQSVLENI